MRKRVAAGAVGGGRHSRGSGVASANTIYPQAAPTFVGPAATGCASGCSLLTGPFTTASTASVSSSSLAAASLKAATALSRPHAMPGPTTGSLAPASMGFAAAAADAAPTPVIPTVRCQPLGAGCDSISTSAGGATGVKGLNAVDSASLATNILSDIEPPGPGPVRRQRIRRRDQQHRRDPGLQHRAAAPIRADPVRHDHGAHRPRVEQRRGSVLRV